MRLNPGQQRGSKLLTGPQRHTLFVGGSRSGKTTLFTEAIMMRASRAPGSRHAMLRQHANAARSSLALDTIPKVAAMRFQGMELVEHRQDGYFSLPNGSEMWVGGLDDKDRVDKILGKEYATIFLNECSQIPYATVLTVRTRLAQVVTCPDGSVLTQRGYYDLNPVGKRHWSNVEFGEHRDPVSHQPQADPENFVRCFINPPENAENLTPEYLRELSNLPLRQRQRFWDGAYVDEVEGALWSYEVFERGRVDSLPEQRRRRIVVAVDPSGAAGPAEENPLAKNDDIGIAVVALGDDGHGYVLADRSLKDGPAAWGKAAVQAYHEFGADAIVAEVNFGGEMVRFVIKAADSSVNVKVITASRAKAVRAEPVASLYGEPPEYKNIRVHHVGRFPALEDQLCSFTTGGYRGEGSPDRADAVVWAVTELMLAGNAQAWIDYAAKLSATSRGETTKPAASVAGPEPRDRVDAVHEAYTRIVEAATDKTVLCGWCGEPIKSSSRVSDGEHQYHADADKDCYRALLASSSPVRINADS